jgi:hypothetical protein
VLGTIWAYMTPEYVMLEMTYHDLLELIRLIPKEKADFVTEEKEPSVKEMKSNFGKLGSVKRVK